MGTTRSLCVVRTTHKFKSLGFVCSPSFFSLPAACRLFSRGVIFTRARVSPALLSLRKNGGLLVVYLYRKGKWKATGAEMCPASVSGMVTGDVPVSYWLIVFLALETVPEVFAKVNSS